MTVRVFNHDVWMQITFVVNDQAASRSAGILFDSHRFIFDDILVADLSVDFSKNRNTVWIPLANGCSRLDFFIFIDHQLSAGGNFMFFKFPSFGIQDRDFPISGQHNLISSIIHNDFHPSEFDNTALFDLGFVLFD